ncbi:hypothetical protein ALI22I_32350 [Saccharothrix sp. ALI-22-I]|uniref:hypothetical protein n=1 Tax=Saccharothrix sp. ALI-22-I TaxID=1933778 RepID=UPI00097C655E|nr:hypothetical protein [Saccharothrix sp. ALI-22-I]ONI83243.1 hypothetical protein ALI22I_32350 [Saccharothrix sp. ALI-22-I]
MGDFGTGDLEDRLRARVEQVRWERSRVQRLGADVVAHLPEHREVWRAQARAFARVAAEIGMGSERISAEYKEKKRFIQRVTLWEHDVLFVEGGVAVTTRGELVEVDGDRPVPFAGFLDEGDFTYDALSVCLYRDRADDRADIEDVVGIRRSPRGLACCVTASGELVVVCDGGEGNAFMTFERRLAEVVEKWA